MQSPHALCNSSKDVSEQAMGQNKSLVIYRIIKILIAAMFLSEIGLYFQESRFPRCPRLLKAVIGQQRDLGSPWVMEGICCCELEGITLKITGLASERLQLVKRNSFCNPESQLVFHAVLSKVEFPHCNFFVMVSSWMLIS